ncbi:MAG: hypothetical protein OEM39_09430 [Acidimicrobiia bacterium]|nr:hypothetical protein [Acidimicrobiia bacterium]MDH3462161.1 hypothetical protein [Acidimicrobiia bacterium]
MRDSSGVVERVVESDLEGRIYTHYGVPICKGPGMYRLMVTWPAADEGRIIEIPRGRITEIAIVRASSRGEMPTILELSPA